MTVRRPQGAEVNDGTGMIAIRRRRTSIIGWNSLLQPSCKAKVS